MEVVHLDRMAGAGLATLIGGMQSEQFTKPTPCPGWTAGDLVAHVIGANAKYTAIAEGAEWRLGVDPVVLGDDPAADYRRTLDIMLAAWEQPGALAREVQLPQGPGPAEGALYLHLGETLVHGWDLAKATDQHLPVDDEVVEASLAWYRSWLPPERPPTAPFANARLVDAAAGPLDRLAAYLGRDV